MAGGPALAVDRAAFSARVAERIAAEPRISVHREEVTSLPGADEPCITVLATGPNVEARYDKIHLYDAFGVTESESVSAGRQPVVVDVDDVGVGITLCYDIRFPALYAELADRGASVITVSASWGAGPGKLDQWTLLARARALDSTCIVAAAGQGYPGAELAAATKAPTGVGGSLVCSPLGEVLVQAGPDAQLVVCDADVAAVPTVRKTLAVLRNRSEFAQIDRAESRA